MEEKTEKKPLMAQRPSHTSESTRVQDSILKLPAEKAKKTFDMIDGSLMPLPVLSADGDARIDSELPLSPSPRLRQGLVTRGKTTPDEKMMSNETFTNQTCPTNMSKMEHYTMQEQDLLGALNNTT